MFFNLFFTFSLFFLTVGFYVDGIEDSILQDYEPNKFKLLNQMLRLKRSYQIADDAEPVAQKSSAATSSVDETSPTKSTTIETRSPIGRKTKRRKSKKSESSTPLPKTTTARHESSDSIVASATKTTAHTVTEPITGSNKITLTTSGTNDDTKNEPSEMPNSNNSSSNAETTTQSMTVASPESTTAISSEGNNLIGDGFRLAQNDVIVRPLLYQLFKKDVFRNILGVLGGILPRSDASAKTISTDSPIVNPFIYERDVVAFFRPHSFKEQFSELFARRNKKSKTVLNVNQLEARNADDSAEGYSDYDDYDSSETARGKRQPKRNKETKSEKCSKDLEILKRIEQEKAKNKDPTTTTEPETTTRAVEYWKTTKADKI